MLISSAHPTLPKGPFLFLFVLLHHPTHKRPIFLLPLAPGTFLLQGLWATFPIVMYFSPREIAVGNIQGAWVGEGRANSHNSDYLPSRNTVVKREWFLLHHQNVSVRVSLKENRFLIFLLYYCKSIFIFNSCIWRLGPHPKGCRNAYLVSLTATELETLGA